MALTAAQGMAPQAPPGQASTRTHRGRHHRLQPRIHQRLPHQPERRLEERRVTIRLQPLIRRNQRTQHPLHQEGQLLGSAVPRLHRHPHRSRQDLPHDHDRQGFQGRQAPHKARRLERRPRRRRGLHHRVEGSELQLQGHPLQLLLPPPVRRLRGRHIHQGHKVRDSQEGTDHRRARPTLPQGRSHRTHQRSLGQSGLVPPRQLQRRRQI